MSWGRIVALVFALLLLAAGAPFFHSGCYFTGIVEHLATHESMRMSVDLSTPGEYRGALHTPIHPPHGETVRLVVNPSYSGTFDDFEGRVRVYQRSGAKVFETQLGPNHFADPMSFPIHDKGEYQVILNVLKPAAGLAKHNQLCVAKHFDCGLDGLNVLIGFSVAGLCWFGSLSLTAWVVWPRKKKSP